MVTNIERGSKSANSSPLPQRSLNKLQGTIYDDNLIIKCHKEFEKVFEIGRRSSTSRMANQNEESGNGLYLSENQIIVSGWMKFWDHKKVL